LESRSSDRRATTGGESHGFRSLSSAESTPHRSQSSRLGTDFLVALEPKDGRSLQCYGELHAIGDDFLTPNGTAYGHRLHGPGQYDARPKFLKNNAHGASQKTQPFSLLTPEQAAELDRWDATVLRCLASLDPPASHAHSAAWSSDFLPILLPKIRDRSRPKSHVAIQNRPTQPVDITSQFGEIFARTSWRS